MAVTPTSEDFDVSPVAGNAPEEIKRFLGDPKAFFASFWKPGQRPLNVFGKAIEDRMKVTELSLVNKVEEPIKVEGRAVLEIDVAEDMVNGGGNLHGGCSAFLVDMASTFAVTLINLSETGKVSFSVSQALNIIYHSPAAVGDRLRLVNTTMTVSKRIESVRTEIWNDTHHRLVVSGVHIKMTASPPKASL